MKFLHCPSTPSGCIHLIQKNAAMPTDPSPASDKTYQKSHQRYSQKQHRTHPENYRLVAVKDMSIGETFITKSCAETKETITIDGTEYPLIKREITNASHPFYTGKMKLVDTAGRIDKFKNRYAKFSK